MASKTIYTSTISVPIYASWKCPFCNVSNFSKGFIKCQYETSSSSWSSKKQNDAKERASSLVREKWTEYAFGIISHPETHSQEVRNDLIMENTNCTNCGKKPKWDKGMVYLNLISFAILPLIISGIVAFSMKNSIIAWIIFAVLLGIVMFGFISKKQYRKLMLNMPKQYMPVIGSLNEDLIAYAAEKGNKLLTPEECIANISNYDIGDTKRHSEKQFSFCRKCGAPLYSDSGFCHKCGEKVIR